MIPEGSIELPDRFRLDKEIGRGGMAVVYRAHDRHLDRFVAIKVLSPDLSNEVGVERFQREIALTAKLVHPGIVALFDSGEAGGRLYYVMPLVAGETLRARVTREKRTSIESALAFCADVAEALAYAHGFGIIHRDVKPENIFTLGGRAILADFGIARFGVQRTTAGSALTAEGLALGTVAYMSPEQALGDVDVDHRSDLYSLGCVLYELLTGAPPFMAGSAMAVLARQITEAPRPARESNPEVSLQVEELLAQLLAKDPAHRPGSASEVARLLRNTQPRVASAPDSMAPSEADILVAEGRRVYSLGATGGRSGRSYLDQAEVYFRQALAKDPQHARALCGLGNWHYLMGNAGYLPREEAFATGRELIFRALAADPFCAEVHCAMGKGALYYSDDCHAAAYHSQRAAMLDPGDSEVLRFQSIVQKILGHTEDAVRSAREATKYDPGLPSLWNTLGDALMAAGRNAEAVDALKQAIGLQSGFKPALERLELARTRLGELDLAVELRAARARLGGMGERADLLMAEAETMGAVEALGRDLRRELDGLLKQAAEQDPFGEYFTTRTLADRIMLGHAALGEWKLAMDWVERAHERRPGRLRRMLTDMPFDHRGLAVDPRYARLLRVAGLEDLV